MMKNAFYSPAYQRHGWNGRISLLKKVYKAGVRSPLLGYRFPTGLLSMVDEVFGDVVCDYKSESVGEVPVPTKEFLKTLDLGDYKLRSYQAFIIQKMLKYKRGVVSAATGSGKSLCAAALIKHLGYSTIVMVPTLDLLYQTRAMYSKYLGIDKDEIGIIGEGQYEPKEITVASVPTLRNMVEVVAGQTRYVDEEAERFFKFIKVVISDESHLVGDNTFFDVFMGFSNAEFRYGMSATPFDRSDGNTLMLIGATGPLIARVKPEDLMKRGILAIPDITIFRIDGPRLSGSATYQQTYRQGIVENCVRNEKIIELVKQHKGQKILIIFDWKIHGKLLSGLLNEAGIDHRLLWGEISGQEREQARNDFEYGDLNCIVASSIFRLGVDLPSIKVLIRVDGRMSTISTIQTIGRALRVSAKGDAKVFIYDFMDSFQKHLIKHSKHRLKDYYSLGKCVVIKQIDLNTGQQFLAM